jgi:hypothetical protein
VSANLTREPNTLSRVLFITRMFILPNSAGS